MIRRILLSMNFFLLAACQVKTPLTGNEVVSNKRPVPVLAIKQEAPEYPKHAALSCINGHVQLEFTVLTDGSVKDIVVFKASPVGVFEAEAITAVSKWRFMPIEEEQKVSQRLEFKFNMKKCNKLLIRQSQFDFTDGISKDEALYMAQNYCIQTHRDEYLNIFNPNIFSGAAEESWVITYKQLSKALNKADINKSGSEALSQILPFIIFINKKTGLFKHISYGLNTK